MPLLLSKLSCFFLRVNCRETLGFVAFTPNTLVMCSCTVRCQKSGISDQLPAHFNPSGSALHSNVQVICGDGRSSGSVSRLIVPIIRGDRYSDMTLISIACHACSY